LRSEIIGKGVNIHLLTILAKVTYSFLITSLVVVLAANNVVSVVSQTSSVNEPAPSLELAGHFGGQTDKVALSGNYAYLASGPELTILDVSTPSNPYRAGYALAPGMIYGLAVQGCYVYIAWNYWNEYNGVYSGGVMIFDVSTPSNPVEVGSHPLPGGASGLAISGNYLYALWYIVVYDEHSSYTEGGLQVLDISDPQAIVETGHIDYGNPNDEPTDIAIGNGYAYLITEIFLYTLSMENPAQPQQIREDCCGGKGISIAGDHAYIANSLTFVILSLANPAEPVLEGFVGNLSFLKDVKIQDHYAYVSEAGGYDGNTWKGGGIHVMDVISPTNPVEVSYFAMPNGSYGLDVHDHIAYVSAYNQGLRVLDASNPAKLIEIGAYRAPGSVDGLTTHGSHVFTLTVFGTPGTYGLRAINITNRRFPVEEGFLGFLNGFKMDVDGNLAYVESSSYANFLYTNTLRVIDISNASSMKQLGLYVTISDYAFKRLVEQDGYAYVAYQKELVVLDARDPANILVTAEITATTGIVDVAMNDHYLYIPDGGLRIFDVSDPSNPVSKGSLTFPGGGSQIALSGKYVYIYGGQGLHIVDVSNPANPVETGFVALTYSTGNIAAEGGYVFLAANYDGLRVVDATDPSHPFETASFNIPGYAAAVDVQYGYIYVAEWSAGLYIFRFNPLIHETFFPIIRR
jgi:hypothetical protein